MVSASQRGRSNQRKGGYHERKNGKKLGELTGFTFQRNFEQRMRLMEFQKQFIMDVYDNPYGTSRSLTVP